MNQVHVSLNTKFEFQMYTIIKVPHTIFNLVIRNNVVIGILINSIYSMD